MKDSDTELTRLLDYVACAASLLRLAEAGLRDRITAAEKERRAVKLPVDPAEDYGNLNADEKFEVPANWVLAEPGTEIIERPVLVLTRETVDSYGHWWRSKKTSLDVDPELYKAVYVPPAKSSQNRKKKEKELK